MDIGIELKMCLIKQYAAIIVIHGCIRTNIPVVHGNAGDTSVIRRSKVVMITEGSSTLVMAKWITGCNESTKVQTLGASPREGLASETSLAGHASREKAGTRAG